MTGSGPSFILLTGAPTASSLEWDAATLSAPLQACFTGKLRKTTLILPPPTPAPAWRQLPLNQQHLPTGLTQASYQADAGNEPGTIEEASFASAADISSATSDDVAPNMQIDNSPQGLKDDSLSDFYEESFAVHNLPSSQVIGNDALDGTFLSTSDAISDVTTSQSTQEPSQDFHSITRARLALSRPTDLQNIPNAGHLRSITPQTMTIDLVVGIISIPAPRMVKTRTGSRTLELVEMVVGDETKAGFTINIWLPAAHEAITSQPRTNDLWTELSALRPQDVVLAKNVALNSFRGRVYGQSLRRGVTSLNLLYRIPVDATDLKGAFTFRNLQATSDDNTKVTKLARVRYWVMSFVGTGTRLPGDERRQFKQAQPHAGKKANLQCLPVDTP